MDAYLDSSVLLRVIFAEKKQLSEFRSIRNAVSSELLRVECLRTIDRIRHAKKIDEATYAQWVELYYRFQRNIELIPVGREVLNRAAQPFPTGLGTLDAIHLASSILYRERLNSKLIFCTHDQALLLAAKAVGFTTVG